MLLCLVAQTSEFWDQFALIHICGHCVQVYVLLIMTGGARGVMVIVVGNGHGDTSSNPGRD